jgi:predicted DNA-binding protein (MmcQ/YjbR family)
VSRDAINAWCSALKGAEVSSPFGPGLDVWKVAGKIFAVLDIGDLGVCVKCRDIEAAALLIASGAAVKAPYFHRSWTLIPHGAMPDDELRQRITLSWRIIAQSLSKKLQAQLHLSSDPEQ